MIGSADSISAAQCRAGRALIEWNQDRLAESARVARPTVADFERNTRFPTRANLISIISALEAAGVEFIGEEDGGGAGVRLRRVELEHSKSLRSRDTNLVVIAKYRGERVDVVLPRELLDDLARGTLRTETERLGVAQEHFHQILVAAEALLSRLPLPLPTAITLAFGDLPRAKGD